MAKDVFSQAKKLYRRKQFGEVISLLEPEILSYRKSFSFYYLLGMSALHLEMIDSAYSYLKSAYMNNEDNNHAVVLAYGVVLLRVGKRQEGITLLLELIQNPETAKTREAKKAKKILNLLRFKGQGDDYIEVLTKAPQTLYLPQIVPIQGIAITTGILLLILVLGVSGFFITRAVQNRPVQDNRSNISVINLNEKPSLTDYSQSDFRYILSDQEIQSAFARAKKHLLNFEDNYCRFELNRLLNSNASLDVKQKCAVLAREIKHPDMKKFKDSFSYEEVAKDPFLYDHCYVKWQGRLTNLQILENQIRFDFLVGYANRKVIEGIVPATLDFECLLNEDFAYEILAMIIPLPVENKVDHPMSQTQFSMKVLTIRRIAENLS